MSEVETGVIAPEAPVVTQATVTDIPASTAETGEETTPEPEEKMLKQSEVDKIIKKRLAQESRRYEREARERGDLIARAEIAERQLKAHQPQEQSKGPPKAEQFESYEEYIEAVTDYKVEQRLQGVQKESQEQHEARIAQERQANLARQVAPKLQKALEKYDDFEEVAATYHWTPAMEAAIMGSEALDDIAYYLGQNRTELQRIYSLSPDQQFRAIVALEGKLSAAPAVTKAPAPIVPTGGKSSFNKAPTDMSYDEFAEFRRKRLAKKR